MRKTDAYCVTISEQFLEKTAVYCAIMLIVFVRKIFEFEFLRQYGAWAVICSSFNTLVKYQNNTVLR